MFGNVDTTDTSNKLSTGLLPEELSHSAAPAPSKLVPARVRGYIAVQLV